MINDMINFCFIMVLKSYVIYLFKLLNFKGVAIFDEVLFTIYLFINKLKERGIGVFACKICAEIYWL